VVGAVRLRLVSRVRDGGRRPGHRRRAPLPVDLAPTVEPPRARPCLAHPCLPSARDSSCPFVAVPLVVEVFVVLVVAVGLGLALGWLIQQFLNSRPTRERAIALLAGVAVVGVALGITLAKAPLAGPVIDHGTSKFAGTVGVAYDPAKATPGACPRSARSGQPVPRG